MVVAMEDTAWVATVVATAWVATVATINTKTKEWEDMADMVDTDKEVVTLT